MPIDNLFNLDEAIKEIEAFYTSVGARGVIPLSAGGDHSITYPILKGLKKDEPFALIHVDAHTDTWANSMDRNFTMAPFRLATDEGIIDPTKTIQIGIRGGQNNLDGLNYSYDAGMRVVEMDEFTDLGVEAVIAEGSKVVGDAPTYITFDVDSIDPVFTPGTGTPEVGASPPWRLCVCCADYAA